MGVARRRRGGARSERSRLWKRVSGLAGRGAKSQQSSRVQRKPGAASMAGSEPAVPPPPRPRLPSWRGAARTPL